MDFLSSISAQTETNLNSANLIYLSDVTTKIVDNGVIVGFICENLTPIRFVGVLDFGVDSRSFDEYMTFKGISSLTYVYGNDITTIPEIVEEDASTTRPYISTSESIVLRQNENKSIIINGGNFDPDVTLNFGPQITVNGFDSITDNQMVVNITAGSSNQIETDIVMTKGSTQSFGNVPTIKVIDSAMGTGPQGTYEWGFNGGSGLGAFDGNWTLEVFGDINSVDDFFMTSDAGTPSNGTGPNSGVDGYYLFGEKSNPNYGTGNYGQMSTSYFRILTEVSFYYHMFGDGIGALVLQSKDSDGIWTERWRRDGEQQSNQSDPFLYTGTIDASSWDAVMLRFVFEDGGYYDGDIAIDKIKFVSI